MQDYGLFILSPFCIWGSVKHIRHNHIIFLFGSYGGPEKGCVKRWGHFSDAVDCAEGFRYGHGLLPVNGTHSVRVHKSMRVVLSLPYWYQHSF